MDKEYLKGYLSHQLCDVQLFNMRLCEKIGLIGFGEVQSNGLQYVVVSLAMMSGEVYAVYTYDAELIKMFRVK